MIRPRRRRDARCAAELLLRCAASADERRLRDDDGVHRVMTMNDGE